MTYRDSPPVSEATETPRASVDRARRFHRNGHPAVRRYLRRVVSSGPQRGTSRPAGRDGARSFDRALDISDGGAVPRRCLRVYGMMTPGMGLKGRRTVPVTISVTGRDVDLLQGTTDRFRKATKYLGCIHFRRLPRTSVGDTPWTVFGHHRNGTRERFRTRTGCSSSESPR